MLTKYLIFLAALIGLASAQAQAQAAISPTLDGLSTLQSHPVLRPVVYSCYSAVTVIVGTNDQHCAIITLLVVRVLLHLCLNVAATINISPATLNGLITDCNGILVQIRGILRIDLIITLLVPLIGILGCLGVIIPIIG